MFGIFSTVIIISGGVTVLIGLAFLVGTIRFLRTAERAAGVIVGHEAQVSTDSEGCKTAYVHPVVEFEDAAGKKHRVTLATGTAGFHPFPAGRQVEILYPPDNPEKARIRHFLHLWFFPMICTALGIIAVVFGYFFHAWTSGLA
jgi:hypothetical protein